MATLNSRAAGVLMPVYALRRAHDLGIGDTQAFKEAVDFCQKHGFRVLQTLPIHDTLGDNSPYNPISSHALSGLLLTVEVGQVPGLTSEIFSAHAPEAWLAQLREGRIKYELVRALKRKLLFAAYEYWLTEPHDDEWRDFQDFRAQQKHWLAPYGLFRAIASLYDQSPDWSHWRPEHQTYLLAEQWLMNAPERTDLSHYRESLEFVQWVAHLQWKKVRAYAEERGVLLMGEMSFGVSKSSVDVWTHPELFDLQWSMGTPPVAYFDTNKDSERWGQNWGFPPYLWQAHREQEFLWLRQRIQAEAQYFHVIRLDHLRGYFRAYMFPWQGGAEHAEFNLLTEEEVYRRCDGRYPRMVPGPDQDPITAHQNEAQGRELIQVMKDAAPDAIIFGELMGKLPSYMERTLEDLEIANLSFPLLETDSEGQLQSPHHFREQSLISFGNHDHAPLLTVYTHLLQKAKTNDLASQQLENLLNYARWSAMPPQELDSSLLGQLQENLLHAPQILATFSIADVFGLDLRFNLPGTYGEGTWSDRMQHTFAEYESHSVFGPRLETLARFIRESHRHPLKNSI